jgi:hypothetical protein
MLFLRKPQKLENLWLYWPLLFIWNLFTWGISKHCNGLLSLYFISQLTSDGFWRVSYGREELIKVIFQLYKFFFRVFVVQQYIRRPTVYSSLCLANLVSRYLTVLHHEAMKTIKAFWLHWVQFLHLKQVVLSSTERWHYVKLDLLKLIFWNCIFLFVFLHSMWTFILEKYFQNSIKKTSKWLHREKFRVNLHQISEFPYDWA